jgi:hypothetical protein
MPQLGLVIQPDCLVSSTHYSLYVKFRVPKTFRYADEGHWDRIPSRVGRRPGEAAFVHRYAPCDTALHRLVRPLCGGGGGSSMDGSSDRDEGGDEDDVVERYATARAWLLEAVAAIVRADPRSLGVRNLFGQTPLHLSCCHSFRPVLSCRGVGSRNSSDSDGKRRAAATRPDSDRQHVRIQAALLLIRAYPSSARQVDQHGRTALHCLLEHHYVAARSGTEDGETTKALPQPALPVQLLDELIRNDPVDALRRRTARGECAADIAARRCPSWVAQLQDAARKYAEVETIDRSDTTEISSDSSDQEQ